MNTIGKHRDPGVNAAADRFASNPTGENFEALQLAKQVWEDTNPAFQALTELYGSGCWSQHQHALFQRVFRDLRRERS